MNKRANYTKIVAELLKGRTVQCPMCKIGELGYHDKKKTNSFECSNKKCNMYININ